MFSCRSSPPARERPSRAGSLPQLRFSCSNWRIHDRFARVLRDNARADVCLLVDCLTLWLTNLLMLESPQRLNAERDALLACLAELPGQIVFVSNETGMGVVPLGELTRRFVDEAGWLHQALAERCQRVVLTVAGLPLTLKGTAL